MQSLTSAVPGAIAELLRTAPNSPGKIDFAWKTAVGPAFAKVTAVRLEGTELLVDVATLHWTREIRRATPVILRRLHTLLGSETISTLTVRPPKAEVTRRRTRGSPRT